MNKIIEASVNVSIGSGNTTDVTTNTTLKLLDQSEGEVSSSTLNISQTDISVTVPNYEPKTVPVHYGLTGQEAHG